MLPDVNAETTEALIRRPIESWPKFQVKYPRQALRIDCSQSRVALRSPMMPLNRNWVSVPVPITTGTTVSAIAAAATESATLKYVSCVAVEALNCPIARKNVLTATQTGFVQPPTEEFAPGAVHTRPERPREIIASMVCWSGLVIGSLFGLVRRISQSAVPDE